MEYRVVELEDGVRVQIEVNEQQAEQVAGWGDKINSSFENVKDFLIHVSRPMAEAWREMNKTMQVESAEVELSLSFEASGNIFIANSKAGANFKVKLALKPSQQESSHVVTTTQS